jgi:hypothetical protein
VWKPRRGLYYCTTCQKWQRQLKGAELASYRATRPIGWPCAADSRIPGMGGTATNPPDKQSSVHVHVAVSRKDGPPRTQISLPGMLNQKTPEDVSRRNEEFQW